MRKTLAFITTTIIACITIASITTAIMTWDTWGQTKTSAVSAQTTIGCAANTDRKCLDIDVYEALNIMPREDRPLINPSLGAYYGGTSSPPNPLVISQGEPVTFFIGPQYFLPASYVEDDVKYVPHVGAGLMWPLKDRDQPVFTESIFTNNKLTFNSGDPSNPQQITKEFGHAPGEPRSSDQYLIASGPVTYNNVGEFVATARVQMIRHFYKGCSPSNWAFVPNKDDLCPSGQSPQGHSGSNQDKLIDITVSRLIKVVP